MVRLIVDDQNVAGACHFPQYFAHVGLVALGAAFVYAAFGRDFFFRLPI